MAGTTSMPIYCQPLQSVNEQIHLNKHILSGQNNLLFIPCNNKNYVGQLSDNTYKNSKK